MKKITFSLRVKTLGLCASSLLCSLEKFFIFLQLFLFVLTGALVWMLITILQNGEPSKHTLDERFYEDSHAGVEPTAEYA